MIRNTLKQLIMKRLILVLIFCLFICNSYAQITIMGSTPKVVENIEKYDSLTNFKRLPYTSSDVEKYGPYTFHHLIGQTVMFCGEPYSNYGKPDLKVGEYYKILEILPNSIESGKYDRLKLVNTKDSTVVNTGGINAYEKYNYQLVVLGHYEKMKSLYVGKKFIFIGYSSIPDSYDKADRLIEAGNDTASEDIKEQSVWECVDVQVKPRRKEDGMFIDYRSPVVLIMQNDTYGQHYCYIENEFGKPFETESGEFPIVGPCFRDIEFANTHQDNEQQESTERLEQMTEKYGEEDGELIAQGKVKIGMTTEMCKDAWGEPVSVNKTMGPWGSNEKWTYKKGAYLYFEDGILSSFQN